jgi:hypothetical protein
MYGPLCTDCVGVSVISVYKVPCFGQGTCNGTVYGDGACTCADRIDGDVLDEFCNCVEGRFGTDCSFEWYASSRLGFRIVFC